MAGQSFQLVMRSGPAPGEAFSLQNPLITIGRDPASDITINDAEVSRQHARLTLQSGGYVLEDLGSTNGTFVNGQRLMGPRVLKPGEVISIGEHITLSFEVVGFDSDATVASSSARQQPVASAPVYQAPTPVRPAPQPVASIPGSPEVEEPSKSNSKLWIIVIAAILLLGICICVGVIWYIDANSMWCDVVPFLFPGACP
jgi:pSer/pThr/pTyr-binding forkhead associated (FHA) protein